MKYWVVLLLSILSIKPAVAQVKEYSEVIFHVNEGIRNVPIPAMEIVIKDSVTRFSFSVYTDSNGNATIKLPMGGAFETYTRDPNPEVQYYDSRTEVIYTDSAVKRILIETDLMDIFVASRIPIIHFEKGSFVISTMMKIELDSFISFIGKYKHILFAIEGHTDAEGSPKENFELSLQRARAVKNYIESAGSQNTFVVQAFGGYRPVYDCGKIKCSTQQHSSNERVEFRYIKRVW